MTTVFSICIPRVFSNITWKQVKEVFDDWGVVDRVDMVKKENEAGEKFQRVFVHFTETKKSDDIADKFNELEEGGSLRVFYSSRWFWIVRKSAVPRPEREVVDDKTVPKVVRKVTVDKASGSGASGSHSDFKTIVSKTTSKEIKMLRSINKKLVADNKTMMEVIVELRKQMSDLATQFASISTGQVATPQYCPHSPTFGPTGSGAAASGNGDTQGDMSPPFCPSPIHKD